MTDFSIFFARRDLVFYLFQISDLTSEPYAGRQIQAKFRANLWSNSLYIRAEEEKQGNRNVLPEIF